MCSGGGNPISNAVEGAVSGVQSVGNAASSAVNNVVQGAQQVGQGAGQLASGDLRGLQTMGGGLVNTGSNLYGNAMDATRGVGQGMFGGLRGTPLYGMTQGNLAGVTGGMEGLVRGNIAGLQDLPTDIGAGVQQGLDQIGGVAQDLLDGLGGALGGGGQGGGMGAQAPGYYKDLAKKQAEFGMGLPDQFQAYEGNRFVDPSERTTLAETGIYNNAANSQQAGFNRAGQLMTQGNQYSGPGVGERNFGAVNTKGPQNYTGQQYGNANQNLMGPVNYQQGNTLADRMQQFQDPYQQQVIDAGIEDLNKARQIRNMDISGNAAKVGAFGGSREALMRGQSDSDFMRQAGDLSARLRSQGFGQAADMAQQEQLKRLGLTASDTQNVRGYQSQGALQGQQLGAQSAMQAQRLGASSFDNAAQRALQAGMQGQRLGAQSFQDLQRNQLTQAGQQAQYGQAANNAALQAAQLSGQLGGQMDDRTRQQLFDQRNMGLAQDARGQQQADFNYNQFVDETQRFPGQYLGNLQAAGGLGSRLISQPTAGGGGGGRPGGLQGILGGALSGFAAGGPMGALIGGGMGALGAGVPQNMSGLEGFSLFDDEPEPANYPAIQYMPPTMGDSGGFGNQYFSGD